MINGITIDTYNSNETLYADTLITAIAECMSNVSSSDVQQLEVSAATTQSSAIPTAVVMSWRLGGGEILPAPPAAAGSTRGRVQGVRRRSGSSDAIQADYVVVVHLASSSYSALSEQLQTAVSDGLFDDYLQAAAAQSGASGFDAATSSSVTTQNLLSGGGGGGSSSSGGGDNDDDGDGLSHGALAGLVIGLLGALVLLTGTGYYFLVYRPSPGESDSLSTRGQQAQAQTVEASTVSNPISAADFADSSGTKATV